MIKNSQKQKKKPKNGFNGADIIDEIKVWQNITAVCGTLNGCANAWKAEPQLK